MMRPRRGGAFTALSAALLTTLLTMPAGAVTNPPHDENPVTPLVQKVCLDGIERYQFKHWKGGSELEWETISPEGSTDKFQYENDVWARDDDEYRNINDVAMTKPRARIANASLVCRRTATELDSAIQAAVDSSTAWQQVVNRDQTYAQQAAAFNRWHRDHCVPGGTVDCGATYPTLAETCALNPGLTLSTGEDC
ncbi:hypothetical protein [Candidatus Poriferisodalis sp.]|uniref:hypothetical protein n=1 Tax=Candidatus Poriferisodalis sp. TaxID=3101277 RepID=UPI003B51F7F2